MVIQGTVMAGNDLAEVLVGGRVGYWRLGEPMGSVTAADASGNGNDRTSSGGVTLGQPGLCGADAAALFDGATGRISGPNSATISRAKITMEAKVRWDGLAGFRSAFPRRRVMQALRNTA